MGESLEYSVKSAMRAGQWEEVRHLAQQWSLQPECGPQPYFALNVVFLLRGDFLEAWQVFPRALAEPSDKEKVGDWVTRLQKEFPEEPSILLVQGVFDTQCGKLEDAIAVFERLVSLLPQSPYPHFFLAQIHHRQERLDKAVKAYREAVKRDASYVAARLKLGLVYQELGQLEMAIPQYREVLKIRPDEITGHTNLACALAEQGKLDSGIEEYKKALLIKPDDAEVHFALGGLYENKGRRDLAKRQYEEALRLNPDLGPAATALGWFSYEKGQMDFALDYFSQALKANPDDAQATFGVGRVYEEKRKPEMALQHYQRALTLEKDPNRKHRILNFMDKLFG